MKFVKLKLRDPCTSASEGTDCWVNVDRIVYVTSEGRISLTTGESLYFLDDVQDALTLLSATEADLRKRVREKREVDSTTEGVRQNIVRVVDHYRSVHPTKAKTLKPGTKDWLKIKARLVEGFTPEDLILAIDGNLMCPWHQKRPPGHTIEYIFRKATKVHGFIHLAKHGVVKEEEIGHHKGSEEFADGDRGDVF